MCVCVEESGATCGCLSGYTCVCCVYVCRCNCGFCCCHCGLGVIHPYMCVPEWVLVGDACTLPGVKAQGSVHFLVPVACAQCGKAGGTVLGSGVTELFFLVIDWWRGPLLWRWVSYFIGLCQHVHVVRWWSFSMLFFSSHVRRDGFLPPRTFMHSCVYLHAPCSDLVRVCGRWWWQ